METFFHGSLIKIFYSQFPNQLNKYQIKKAKNILINRTYNVQTIRIIKDTKTHLDIQTQVETFFHGNFFSWTICHSVDKSQLNSRHIVVISM